MFWIVSRTCEDMYWCASVPLHTSFKVPMMINDSMMKYHFGSISYLLANDVSTANML